MSKYELRPVDPDFRAVVDASSEAAAEFASQVMDAMVGMMDKAVRTALVYVPSDEMTVTDDEGNLCLLVRHRPVYVVKANLLSVDVTVDGQWLRWPLVSTEN